MNRDTVVVHRRADAWTALAAAATALVAWAVAGGTVGSFERSIFWFINGLPDGRRPACHAFQLQGVLHSGEGLHLSDALRGQGADLASTAEKSGGTVDFLPGLIPASTSPARCSCSASSGSSCGWSPR